MGAAEDIDIDLRESGGKFLYCQLELDASVAAQIPQPKRCSVSGSNFFGFPADPVVVRKEDERFPGRNTLRRASVGFLSLSAQKA